MYRNKREIAIYIPLTELALWVSGEGLSPTDAGRVFQATGVSRWGNIDIEEAQVAVAAKRSSVDLLEPINIYIYLYDIYDIYILCDMIYLFCVMCGMQSMLCAEFSLSYVRDSVCVMCGI